MIIKEKNKNGVLHYFYICDQCEIKFSKGYGKMLYTLKGKFGEGQKHFCSYQCRANYIKKDKS